MNLILLRHGEATDNVNELISDKEIYWSVLTESGKNVVSESLEYLPSQIDKIYVSPFPRTIETASFVFEKSPKTEVIIDNRLHEITYGKFSHKKNNSELDDTRIKQINNDYFVRFGEYGENRFTIEERLCNFLLDVEKNNLKDNTIVIVTHGSITSYIKRILNVKSSHINTGKLEIINNVDFKNLKKHIKKLNQIKNAEIKRRIELVNSVNDTSYIKKNLIKIAKEEFNNIEFPYEILEKYVNGYNTKNLSQVTNPKFSDGPILICFYCDFENFAEKWINHYIGIGIKNFVLVDNESKDNSTNILKKYSNKVNMSFWKMNELYDCNKMCGWKQRIFEFYGNKSYITVDSDELLVYKDYKNTSFKDFIKNRKYVKSMMLDVYSKTLIYEGKLEDFKYVDRGTYKITSSVPYYQRFFGGPRSRKFGINPSLQKIPFIQYDGKMLFINDHYYYPFNINEKAEFITYLLHYKFLPGDEKKYIEYAKDGRHWNDSREYKIYSNVADEEERITFYDKNISIPVEEIDYNF